MQPILEEPGTGSLGYITVILDPQILVTRPSLVTSLANCYAPSVGNHLDISIVFDEFRFSGILEKTLMKIIVQLLKFSRFSPF